MMFPILALSIGTRRAALTPEAPFSSLATPPGAVRIGEIGEVA